jgi:hypothetical protein
MDQAFVLRWQLLVLATSGLTLTSLELFNTKCSAASVIICVDTIRRAVAGLRLPGGMSLVMWS